MGRRIVDMCGGIMLTVSGIKPRRVCPSIGVGIFTSPKSERFTLPIIGTFETPQGEDAFVPLGEHLEVRLTFVQQQPFSDDGAIFRQKLQRL
jgi:hypothetical protein